MEVLKDRPDVVNWVKKIASDQGMENCNITDVKTNQKGEGFLSQIYIITVKDMTSDQQLDIVAKVDVKDEKGQDIPAIQKCFLNENYFYTKVFPAFKEFERSRGIVENIEFIPRHYSTGIDSEKEIVCLENLKGADFEMFDKRVALDDEHISFIFKIYGRFHAYSYALRDQEPEVFQDLVDGFCNLYQEFVDDASGGFCESLKGFFKLAHKYLIPTEDGVIIQKFEKYLDNGVVDIFRNIVIQTDDSFAITHGDCWSNNMMFKYKATENGKTLCDLRFIDLQLFKLGSPVCDLSYCLYSSGCSKDTFDNLNKYLKIYYESFSSFSKALGSDPEKLFSYKTLEEQWKKYARFGMCMGIMVLKLKLTYTEEIKDHSDALDKDEFTDAFVNAKFDEKVFQKRLRELLYHLSEIDVL